MDETAKLDSFLTKPVKPQRVDFLIIGQGICGTFLSYYLMKAGKKVTVIDDNRSFSASRVASGVINPVTGRRIVRTWMIEDLLPFALSEYCALSKVLGAVLLKQLSVLDFHPSHQMKEAFEKRILEDGEYLHQASDRDWKEIFNFYFGVGEINPCLLVDIHSLLSLTRKALQKQNALLEETFYPENLLVFDSSVVYKNLIADKIIYCDGVSGINNQYFKNLPYSLNKGEAIIARISDLRPDYIYKQGNSIVPWRDDLFWVGSSYEWNFDNIGPTTRFREKIVSFLNNFLRTSFEIVDHIASVRPANMERRPFVGLHPNYPNVGILNGMGTKGCSLAPFFGKQLAEHLTEGKEILPEADVKRFTKILARKMN